MALLRVHGPALGLSAIAAEVLHVPSGVSAGPAEAILRRTLASDPRLSVDEDGLCSLVEDSLPANEVAASVWIHLTGPRPPLDRPLAFGFRGRRGGAVTLPCDPGGPVLVERLRALGLRSEDLRGAPTAARGRRAIVDLVGGDALVVWDRVQARLLAPDLVPAVVLAPFLLRAGCALRRDGPVAAAAVLGVPWDGDASAGAIAGVVLALHDAAAEEGLLEVPEPEAPLPPVPAWVTDLPDGPGVYRFLGDGGEVLYVGKARSLRARVRTYFGRSDRRSRHAELMARATRVDFEETASEAEALLVEADRIRELSPPYNVQRRTARRVGSLGDAVLFLPGAGESVQAILVVSGRVAARVEIGPRRRGIGVLDDAIRRHVFRDEPPPEDEGAGEILKTWLRREGDRVSHVDLATVNSAARAFRLVRAYLDDPDLLRGRVVHRE